MRFVNNEDLVFCFDWCEFDAFPQFSYFINAAVGCRIHFNEIKRSAEIYVLAKFTSIAWLAILWVLAIQTFCEYPRHAGFARASRPGKEVCVPDSSQTHGVLKRLLYVNLIYDFGKRPGPVFTVKNQVIFGIVCHLNNFTNFSKKKKGRRWFPVLRENLSAAMP